MRLLENLEIFSRENSRWIEFPNLEKIVRIPDPNLPLRCRYCCRTELIEQAFLRRKNQQFFSVDYI